MGRMNATWHPGAETMHALPLAFARRDFGQDWGGLRTRLGFDRDTCGTKSNLAFAGCGTRNGLRRDKFWTSLRHALDFA